MSRLPMCSSVRSLRYVQYTQRRAESFGNPKEIPWKFFGRFFGALSEFRMVRQPAYLQVANVCQLVPRSRGQIRDCSSGKFGKMGKVRINLPLFLLWLYWLRYPTR